MDNSTATPLRWNDSINQQEYKRSFQQNWITPLPVELNQIPPFQMPRAKTGASITSFKLHHLINGTVDTVTSQMFTAGLTVLTYTDKTFDIVKYPSNVLLTGVSLELGAYYAEMSDGSNTWYSDVFTMVSSLADTVTISWCHAQTFDYTGGHIDYSSQYQNHLNIKADIARPDYIYDEEVQNLDGYVLPLRQSSWKVYKMEFLLGEFLLDAMRLIRLHDHVTITNNRDGRVYDVDDFLLLSPEWSDTWGVALVNIEFRTDTVSVVSGRGVDGLPCGAGSSLGDPVGPADCADINYECVATIEEGGAEWAGEYYTPTGGGPNVSFITGDYIMVIPTGGPNYWHLYQFNGSGYTQIIETSEAISYDNDGDQYFFVAGSPWTNWEVPELYSYFNTNISGQTTNGPRIWNVTGIVPPGGIMEIFAYDESGVESLVAVAPGTGPLGVNIQVEFAWSPSYIGVVGRVSTPTCRRYTRTDLLPFEGINYWFLETPAEFEVQT